MGLAPSIAGIPPHVFTGAVNTQCVRPFIFLLGWIFLEGKMYLLTLFFKSIEYLYSFILRNIFTVYSYWVGLLKEIGKVAALTFNPSSFCHRVRAPVSFVMLLCIVQKISPEPHSFTHLLLHCVLIFLIFIFPSELHNLKIKQAWHWPLDIKACIEHLLFRENWIRDVTVSV